MQVRKIAGALGAEISGVDLTRGTTPALAADIRKVFLEHQVIFLRGQDLGPQQFLDFATAMGKAWAAAISSSAWQDSIMANARFSRW